MSPTSRDDDVSLTDVPEADAAEQQQPLDPEETGDSGDGVEDASADLDRASEADVLEQRQTVTGDEDYPHGGAEED